MIRIAPPSRPRGPRALTLAAAAALAGCETAVPGSSTYSCSGIPEGVVCQSARDMHARTSARDSVHEADLVAPDAAAGVAAAAPAASGPREGILDAAALAPPPFAAPDLATLDVAALAAAPRRGSAGVVRIWIAPWEDRQGDLRMPGYVFAEVRPPRWSLSERPAHVSVNHLQTPQMIEARDRPATTPEADTPAAGEPLSVRRRPAEPAPSQRRRPPEAQPDAYREART